MIDKLGIYATYLLGDPTVDENANFQVTILRDNWFAAEVIDKGSFCFVGCTVNPGFEFEDFLLANRASLMKQFPDHSEVITKLTRVC